jgi:hypothetical protein
MAGSIKIEVREQRVISVLGFIFLFRVVRFKDLDLLGSTVLGINMRRTIEYLKRQKLVDNFAISTPVKTSGYWLLEAGLKKLPKSLLQYGYKFSPVWFRPGRLAHNSGVIEVCLLFQKLDAYGYWVSEWMIRKDMLRKVAKRPMRGRRAKTALRGRLPDGFYVINKGGKVAVEFESTRKNIHNWSDMIRDLEYGLNDRKKIDPNTDSIVTGRDFEAVLFVFTDVLTLELYRRRFDEYSNYGRAASGGNNHEKVVLNPQCYFLTTMNSLKNGKVFRGGKEIDFVSFLETVSSLHNGVITEKVGAEA